MGDAIKAALRQGGGAGGGGPWVEVELDWKESIAHPDDRCLSGCALRCWPCC